MPMRRNSNVSYAIFFVVVILMAIVPTARTDEDDVDEEESADTFGRITPNDASEESDFPAERMHDERTEPDESASPEGPGGPSRRNFLETLAYFGRPRPQFEQITSMLPFWNYDTRVPFFVRRNAPLIRRATSPAYLNYVSSADLTSTLAGRRYGRRSMSHAVPQHGNSLAYRRKADAKSTKANYPTQWQPCMKWLQNNMRVCKVTTALKSLQTNLKKRNSLMKKAYSNGLLTAKPKPMTVADLLTAVMQALKRMNENLHSMVNQQLPKAGAVEAMDAEEDAEDEEMAADEMDEDAEVKKAEDTEARKTKGSTAKKGQQNAKAESRRKLNDKKKQPQNQNRRVNRKKDDGKAPSLRIFSEGNVDTEDAESDGSIFKEDFGNRIFVDDVQHELPTSRSNNASGSMMPNVRGDFSGANVKSSGKSMKGSKSTADPTTREANSKSADVTGTTESLSAASKKGNTGNTQRSNGQNSTTPMPLKDKDDAVSVENRMFLGNVTLVEKNTTDPANRSTN